MADRKTGDGRNGCEVHCTNDSSEEEPEDKNLWPSHLAQRWIAMLFVGTCLLYCARMAMPICAVTMAATFHWSKIDSGLVLGGFFWGYCFTQILGGHASDKVGGERVLFISAVSWGLLTFITPLLAKLGSHTFALMTLVRFFMGLLQGVFFPSLASLCSHRVIEGERGFVMSTMSSGGYLGILLAGAMGSLMLDRYGWESIFYTIGFLSGLWALMVWLFFLKGDVVLKKVKSSTAAEWSLSRTQWLSLFKEPPVWAMVFAHMCICSSGNTLLSWMPTYFKESFPHAEGWAGNVIPWMVAIPSSLCGGYISDFLINQGYSVVTVRKLMQFFAMGVSSLLLTPLPGAVSYSSAVILISAFLGLTTFTGGGVSVNVQDLTPSCAGALFGFMNMLGAFGGLLMISVSGYLIEVTQSWAWVFSLITLVNTSGLVIFLILGDARRVDMDGYSRVDEF